MLPTGDLEWAPQPFEFKAGESVRYIDFDGGNDANDGTSKQTPWKHHPWDPERHRPGEGLQGRAYLCLQAGRGLPRRAERARIRHRWRRRSS